MNTVFSKIHQLQQINSYSKHDHLIQGIISAIEDKLILKGDRLPSVNQMIKELGYARETITKGYKELISRGIIESKNRHGYYLLNEDIGQVIKVALILYAFDSFQENLYKSFRKGLGKNAQLDVFFHHNNIETFESIIINTKGKYGMYVIAPISGERSRALLEAIPTNRFLMIDRYEPLNVDFSYIVQEFEDSAYKAFCELSDKISEYDEFVLFFREETAEPGEILNAFNRFISDYGINGKVLREYEPGSVSAGKIYFTIHNPELYTIIKDSIGMGLLLGSQVGLLSHNDDVVKEIISGGITTFSTDFTLMGSRAAEAVLEKIRIKEVIPTTLARRNSL